VQRLLRERQVRIIEATDAQVHVSGHPKQDELRALYEWVQPRCVIPVHGTPMHLDAHAELVSSMGIASVRVRNGDILRIDRDCRIVGQAPIGVQRRVERPRSEHSRAGRRSRRIRRFW